MGPADGSVLDLRSNIGNAGGTVSAAGTFINAATVAGDVTITAAGTWSNLAGATVTGSIAAYKAALAGSP